MAENPPLTLALYCEIVEGARDAVLITERTAVADDGKLDDPNPTIIYVNPAFEKMTGYSREEVLGKSPRFLQGEKTERDRLDKIRAALKSWEPVRTTLTNYRKDGSEFTVELDIFPSWDGDELRYWIAIQRDVTDRFDETIALQERLNSKRLKSLAAGVAHDFNNLLQIILGFTNLLQIEAESSATVDHESQRHLEAIENASRSAADLCSQLLSYAGQKKRVGGYSDISETVQKMTELLRASVGKRANLSAKLPPHLPKVCIDEVQLQQVMLNLVVNAAEACEPNGNIVISAGELNIDSLSDHRKDILAAGLYVFIDVTDDGPGMSQELLKNVFDPYFSTKGDRGLGLASSLGIVHAHRGDIHVHSTDGGGSTFRVLLPVTVDVQDTDDAVESKSAARQRMVLVIEDQPAIQALLRRSLARHGVEVVCRDNGREGLTIAEKLKADIDLVISDVQLPDISGVNVLQKIRQRSPDLPVLLISGVANRTLHDIAQNDENTSFLAKPFSLKELESFLKTTGLEAAWNSDCH